VKETYLAELLLDKDYEVHGIKRRTSSFNTCRINHIYQDPPQGVGPAHAGSPQNPAQRTRDYRRRRARAAHGAQPPSARSSCC